MDNQEQSKHNREFMRLLSEHERRLTAYVHSLIPAWHDAEDVLQNTKIRLWEQFDSYRPDADFAAWALAIARYMVLAHRTLHQRNRVSFSDDLLERITQKATSYNDDERMPALADCVRSLSDAARRLLCLVCSEHRRIKDIASELGQKPSTTRMTLLRIRRSLLECVRKRLAEEKRL
jgi:RNA polymerase sigma-70 factor (ECF subfamily)